MRECVCSASSQAMSPTEPGRMWECVRDNGNGMRECVRECVNECVNVLMWECVRECVNVLMR